MPSTSRAKPRGVKSGKPESMPQQPAEGERTLNHHHDKLQKDIAAAVQECQQMNQSRSQTIAHSVQDVLTALRKMAEEVQRASAMHGEEQQRLHELLLKANAETDRMRTKAVTIEKFFEKKIEAYNHLLQEERRAVQEIKSQNEVLTQRLNAAAAQSPRKAPPSVTRSVSPNAADIEDRVSYSSLGIANFASMDKEAQVKVLISELKHERSQRLASEEQGNRIQAEQGRTIASLEQRVKALQQSITGLRQHQRERSMSPVHRTKCDRPAGAACFSRRGSNNPSPEVGASAFAASRSRSGSADSTAPPALPQGVLRKFSTGAGPSVQQPPQQPAEGDTVLPPPALSSPASGGRAACLSPPPARKPDAAPEAAEPPTPALPSPLPAALERVNHHLQEKEEQAKQATPTPTPMERRLCHGGTIDSVEELDSVLRHLEQTVLKP